MAADLIGDRYRLLEPIGVGGMGQVFRAEDLLAHAPVCVKRAREHDARSAVVARVRREFRVGSMVAHPNLLPVLDLVEEGGEPWLVMELIEGPSLEDLLVGCGGEGLRAAGVVALGRQLARGLAWFHEWVGEKHRDIKPGNILIEPARSLGDRRLTLAELVPAPGEAPSFRAMIADFGLATGATRISRSDAVPGTIMFTAPEVMRLGRSATVRSDLYSLGRTLECAILGQPQPSEVEPTSAGALREAVGDRLAGIVGRLLAPDPEQRLASAAELEGALEEIAERASLSAFGSSSGSPRAFFRRARLDELLHLCESPVGPEGRLVFLRGAPLSGRATLLHRLARILDAPAMTVRHGERALEPLARLAQDLIAMSAEEEEGRRRRVLGDEEGALRILVGLGAKEDGLGEEPLPPVDPLAQALGRVLRRHFEEASPNLLVHDLDLAATEAIACLEQVLQVCGRVTLVASVGLDRLPERLERFAQSARRRWADVREIECGEISPVEAAGWVQWACEGVSQREAGALAEEALAWFGRGARALSLGLGQLRAEGLLERGEGGALPALGVESWPGEGRLGRLYARQREGLPELAEKVLSLLDPAESDGIGALELAAGMEQEEIPVADALEELRLRALVRIRAPVGDRPSYALAAGMLHGSGTESRAIDPAFHERAARALDRLDDPEALRRCAFHLEKAGRSAEAVEKLTALARRLDPLRPPEAVQHRLHALSLLPESAMRPKILLEAAQAALQHEPPTAGKLFAGVLGALELLPVSERGAVECEARGGLVTFELLMGRPEGMKREIELLDALDDLDEIAEHQRLLARATPILESDAAAALELLDRCAPRSGGELDRFAFRWAEIGFWPLYSMRRFDEAEQHAELWRDRALARGHEVAMAVFLMNLAQARAAVQRLDEAERTLVNALELARKSGASLRILQVALALGRLLVRNERASEGREVFCAAEALARRCGKYNEARVSYELGTVCAHAELWNEAQAHYSRSFADLTALRHRHRFYVAANLVEARMSTGDLEGARETLEWVMTDVADSPDAPPALRDSLLVWARVIEGMLLVSEGHPEKAVHTLREAMPETNLGAAEAVIREHWAEGLCDALRGLGRAEEAEPIALGQVEWTKSEQLASRAPAARRLFAGVLADRGRLDEALDELRIGRGIAVALGQRWEESKIFSAAARIHEKADRIEMRQRCRTTARALKQWLREGILDGQSPA
ncbi:MAG: hypothetical protein CME06_05320 [Gemmatimonadetes bacterium]|nr:hypothetical protein [Gemmatimonadota bacterium]